MNKIGSRSKWNNRTHIRHCSLATYRLTSSNSLVDSIKPVRHVFYFFPIDKVPFRGKTFFFICDREGQQACGPLFQSPDENS
jgi:hypothetical protein